MNIHQCPYSAEMSPSSPSNNSSTAQYPTTDISSKPIKMKRSFDVAFLMKPDDFTKKRQKFELKQHLQFITSANIMSRYPPPVESPIDHVNDFTQHTLNGQEDTINIDKDEDDPKLMNREPIQVDDQYSDCSSNDPTNLTRSAFSKFDSLPTVLEMPPILRSPSSVSTLSGGVSPDSCHDSISPPLYLKNKNKSPISFMQLGKPIQFYNRVGIHPNATLPFFANPLPNPYTSPYILNEKDRVPDEPDIPNNYARRSPIEDNDKSKLKTSADYRMYPGNGLPPYVPCPFPPTANVPLLTTANTMTASLLPSSLAALTLPAQNVCAKCNVSFRMTSDLVYHMRSHHKADSIAHQTIKRRKDQDKLKCPVCNESFRERHHLTRHMTAHQDKDGDVDHANEIMDNVKRKAGLVHGNAK